VDISKNEHYKRGIALFDSGLYSEAIAEFEKVLDSAPESEVYERKMASFYLCEAYANLGLSHLRCEMYARAEEELKKALALHPEYPDLHYQLGVVYYKQGKFAEAERELREALRSNPNYAKAMLYMAITRLQLGFDDGIDFINRAVKIQPAYGGYKLERALDLYKNSQAQEAFRLIEELAEIDVDKVGYLLNKGVKLMKRQAYLDACHVFLEAIAACPHYADLRHHLGTCYMNLGRIDLAIGQFSKALEINPFFLDARISLANAYEKDGRVDLAIEELQHVLYLDPHNSVAAQALERLQSGSSTSAA
jgi:tetratricopeptide (TPR) repeat protein